MRTLFLLCLLILSLPGISQNLFDFPSSLNYADHLYRSGEYGLAVREYERLVFMDSTNSELQFRLLRSYRMSRDFGRGIYRAGQLFPDPLRMNTEISGEFALLLLHEKRFSDARRFTESASVIGQERKAQVMVASSLFLSDYEQALTLSRLMPEAGPQMNALKQIAAEAASMELKSHGLALALSAAVPGLGKAYAGAWKDGLLSFIFTGAAVYQAYRGFEKHGTNSGYGWIYGGLAAGFYFGNLYGSWKAVSKYNYHKHHEIFHRTELVLDRID
jgi:hypothetical protein